MANPEHLAKLKEGVEVWNAWRKKYVNEYIDLRGANLSRANLNGARFDLVDLSGADLSQAFLNGTILTRANLSQANLVQAQLAGANLGGAILNEADLTGANLTVAIFMLGSFTRTNFTATTLAYTIFANVDLSNVYGLRTCHHNGPSHLDEHTLRISQNLGNKFLQRCGLSEKFITYIPSLFHNQAFQFYSCFISYSSKDEDFARRLYSDLQDAGVRCWFAPEDVRGGMKLYHQIDSAIRVHDKLLLILSPNSMNSKWVVTELKRTLKAEGQQNKRKLFPLGLVDFKHIQTWECFDATVGEDLADKVRDYYIPDFTNWETNSAYQKAFKRLLKDLKEDQPTKKEKAE